MLDRNELARNLQVSHSPCKFLQVNHSTCKFLQDNHLLQETCKFLQVNHSVSTRVNKKNRVIFWCEFQVKYIKNLCCNVITLIGFGKGTLSNHTFRHRAMTLLMDSEHKRFHFFDPDTIVQMLTFDWFKYNYICHEQPWVCDLYPVNLK